MLHLAALCTCTALPIFIKPKKAIYNSKCEAFSLIFREKRNISHFANAKYITRRKAYIAFLYQQKYITARAQHAPCRPLRSGTVCRAAG
jgi:hypothetical protein